MKNRKIRRRPVEAVRKRLIETYVRTLSSARYFHERDFFDSTAHRSVGIRFREPM